MGCPEKLPATHSEPSSDGPSIKAAKPKAARVATHSSLEAATCWNKRMRERKSKSPLLKMKLAANVPELRPVLCNGLGDSG